MKIDLCALTADILPLYADDLLSPETTRLLEEHAATCPSCGERLRSSREGLPPLPLEEPPNPQLEAPARRFFGRLRRLVFYGLVGAVVLLVAAGSLGYQFGRMSEWERAMVPQRVSTADDVARKAVPGWSRAEENGLIVPLGITEPVPETEASITLEKAWYSSRQVYILYTVRAPEGKYVLPTMAFLETEDGKPVVGDGGTDWQHLREWGGFSRDGLHGVLIFSRLNPIPAGTQLKLTIRQWGPVTPKKGLDPGTPAGAGRLSLTLPWRPEYLRERAPEVQRLADRHTWLGRSLTVERLEVGIGQIRLSGLIQLPEGESRPGLNARLLIGGAARDLKEFQAEPDGEAGRYRFTAVFDGPDSWPAPVKLEVNGISFQTDRTLEWPVNWAKYRNITSGERRLMDAEDRVAVKFYDSTLTSIWTWDGGVAIEQKDPSGPPPYVRAGLAIGGRGIGPDHPGMELVNTAGEILTNFGGGGGVIWDGPGQHDERQRVSAIWGDALPENFRRSDRLTLRYVQPSASMVLKETWDLRPAP